MRVYLSSRTTNRALDLVKLTVVYRPTNTPGDITKVAFDKVNPGAVDSRYADLGIITEWDSNSYKPLIFYLFIDGINQINIVIPALTVYTFFNYL